jgi:hypothetical protein
MTRKRPAMVVQLDAYRTRGELAGWRAARAAFKKARGLIRLATARRSQ